MAAVATCSARATATGPLECISLEDPGEPGAWVSMAARKARPGRRDRGRTGRNDRGPVRRRRARHRGPQPAWSRRRDRPRRRVPVPAPFTTPSPGCRRVQVRQRGRGAALRRPPVFRRRVVRDRPADGVLENPASVRSLAPASARPGATGGSPPSLPRWAPILPAWLNEPAPWRGPAFERRYWFTFQPSPTTRAPARCSRSSKPRSMRWNRCANSSC